MRESTAGLAKPSFLGVLTLPLLAHAAVGEQVRGALYGFVVMPGLALAAAAALALCTWFCERAVLPALGWVWLRLRELCASGPLDDAAVDRKLRELLS